MLGEQILSLSHQVLRDRLSLCVSLARRFGVSSRLFRQGLIPVRNGKRGI
jgi:hypothetical protein